MKKLQPLLNLLFLPLLLGTFVAHAQNGSMEYLEQVFPKLTKLYQEELRNCNTHYIFAVDVSGSMKQYNDVVTPAMQAFAKALPVGEQVSVMPFGTTTHENTIGLCCKIDDQSKQQLAVSLSQLYTNEGYTREFRGNTDVGKAVEAINKALLNNRNVQINVIVIITDFLNDLPGIGEQKLQKAYLEKLNTDFDNVTGDSYTRVVALQLPKAGTGVGFCLDQLQETVFCNTSATKRFDRVPAIKDKNSIAHWFEQLSREIMTEKLKAVIELDNHRNRPRFVTEMDIDGNVLAEIHWTPNKLYQYIKLDSTSTDVNSKFVFENNKKVLTTTQDTVLLEIELGQIKHQNYGLHKFDENLNIGLSLPTPYDDELKTLSISKPLQSSSDTQNRWVFTFFLPFYVTLVLLILLILYIIKVINNIIRNSKERFVGTVDFTDSRGRDIGDTVNVKCRPGQTLFIGAGGNSGCDLNGTAWTIKVVKKNSNPFGLFGKPCFEWSAKSGFVKDGKNKKRGYLGRYEKNNTRSRIDLECGPDSTNITHGVKIVIKKNK